MEKNDSKLVLIVEDEKNLLEAMELYLKEAGYRTLTAKNGKEGLEAAVKNHPDLILADHLMPVMDGAAMVQELRKDDWGKGARVIISTNVSDLNTMNANLKAGVDDYILKSETDLKDIVEMVNDHLK